MALVVDSCSYLCMHLVQFFHAVQLQQQPLKLYLSARATWFAKACLQNIKHSHEKWQQKCTASRDKL